MKIKNIDLKNFKSWFDCHMELDKGITAIIGNPQDGKSNILKGINLCANNRPSKYSKFINKHSIGEECSVTITTEDENGDTTKVSITKDGKVGQYQINSDEPLSVIGLSVPDPVKNALMLSEIFIDNQRDEPFLITSSNGEISKSINKVIHIDEINTWLSGITTKFNTCNSDIDICKNELKRLKKKIDKQEYIYDLDLKMNECENLESQINKYKTIVNHLEQYSQLFTNNEQLSEKILKADSLLSEYINESKEFEKSNRVLNSLIILKGINKIKEIDIDEFIESINDYKQIAIKLRAIVKYDINNAYSTSIKSLYNDAFDTYENYTKLLDIRSKISKYKLQDKMFHFLTKKYDIAKVELKNKLIEEKVCPTCYIDLTDNHIKEIMDKY